MTKGRCFCGKIKYRIEGNILNSGVCYCRDCQRLTGGTAWPFIAVPQESLITEGNIKEFSRTGASGKNVHMGFCDECGSTLFGRPEVWPQIRTISASSLNDPHLFLPKIQVWTQDAPKWVLLDPDAPKFEQNPT